MYQTFIGIDIAKQDYVVNQHGDSVTHTFSNNLTGFKTFEKQYQQVLSKALVVLESTGGYERDLIDYLQSKHYRVHRAHASKVKHFIRSYGKLGKSDAIDAKGLAMYAAERHAQLMEYHPKGDEQLELLVNRQMDLKQLAAQEKNRKQAPGHKSLKKSYESVINALDEEIKLIQAQIDEILNADDKYKKMKEVLMTVPGIGPVTAVALIALLPELGYLNRKQIASLAGVAPHPNESGKKVGYRFIRGGRATVKRVLFPAAMGALNSKSFLGEFYQNCIDRKKQKMVAIGALMRKIVVIANARVRDEIIIPLNNIDPDAIRSGNILAG